MNKLNQILNQSLNIKTAFFLKENYDRIQKSNQSNEYKKAASIIYELYTKDFLIDLLQCERQEECICALFPQHLEVDYYGGVFYGIKHFDSFEEAFSLACRELFLANRKIQKLLELLERIGFDVDTGLLFLQKIICDLFNFDLEEF